MPAVRCPNCGAVVEDADVRPHPYIVAPPGCWAAFGTLQAEAVARFGPAPVNELALDAYAASHGGNGSDRRDRQSVLLHLIALRAVLEEGEPLERRIPLLRRLADLSVDWPALEPPPGTPRLNLTHVTVATDRDDHDRLVREWAGAVWAFWAPEHERIAALATAHGRA